MFFQMELGFYVTLARPPRFFACVSTQIGAFSAPVFRATTAPTATLRYSSFLLIFHPHFRFSDLTDS